MPELQKNTTIIPAAPGWNIVDLSIGEKHPDLIFEPVIAWLVTHGGHTENRESAFVRPVTIDGTYPYWQMLQRPDGSYTDVDNDYSSKEAVISEFQRRIGTMNQKGIAALGKTVKR